MKNYKISSGGMTKTRTTRVVIEGAGHGLLSKRLSSIKFFYPQSTSFINKAFVGLGSCRNVQTETSIFEFGTLFQIVMFFLVTPPLKGIDIPMRGLSRIYISCKKRCHAKFLSSTYVVSPGPTSHKKLSCSLSVTF